MAGESLESLLAWMKDYSRLLGWDLIMALSSGKIDRQLAQDYIFRLSQGNDLGDIDVDIVIPETSITHFLSAVKLAAPQLNLEDASLQSSQTAVSLPVIGGTLMTVDTVHGHNSIIRLSELDPLGVSRLTLEVHPGTTSSEVSLDLADGDRALLTVFDTPAQQREAGRLFVEHFRTLSASRRLFPLVTFPVQQNAFMETQHVDVRTQRRDVQPSAARAIDDSGALLLFAHMAGGRSGDFPGDESDFRYLIPEADGPNTWDATALFSQALIHRAAYGHALLELLDEGSQFNRETDSNGMLTQLVATQGTLTVPAGLYRNGDYEFEYPTFSLRAAGDAESLTAEFHEDRATQHWSCNLDLEFKHRPVGGTTWQSENARFSVSLACEFHFSPADAEPRGMEGEFWFPVENTQEVRHVSGLPGTLPPDLLEQIIDFVAQTVKRAILERLSMSLSATATEEFLSGLKIAGTGIMQPTVSALPFDHVKFCEVHARDTSFSIVQPQSLVAAGKTLQLSTEPAREVNWSVENPSGSVGDPGTINAQGLYRAAPAHAMQAAYNRVLVIATDPDTGERAVTMLTVLAQPLTINPCIQTCFHSERVHLSGGSIGAGTLGWSIKNPVVGQSGHLEESDQPGGGQVYIAAPKVANETYVLDEIEVRNSQTDETRSAWVLAIQHAPAATIKPLDDPGQPDGQIQLQAYVNTIASDGEWTLPLDGPGVIDPSGLYIADPLAKDRFVLVMVKIDVGALGPFKGHLILPLPLSDFPAVIKALAQ